MIDRRTFLRGLVAGAAGLLVPKALVTDAEETRRYWALDRTMVPRRMYTYTFETSSPLRWPDRITIPARGIDDDSPFIAGKIFPVIPRGHLVYLTPLGEFRDGGTIDVAKMPGLVSATFRVSTDPFICPRSAYGPLAES